MSTTNISEMAGIRRWIRDIKNELLKGDYNNRSRLQRQLMKLEEIEAKMTTLSLRYANRNMM